MKYKGKKLEGKNKDILVLLRGDEKIVFTAEAVDNVDDFNKLVPLPEAPMRILPGGSKVSNTDDPTFKSLLQEFAQKKTDFYIIQSLRATTELEWETIDFEKPETWRNWEKELKEDFTEIEISRITNLVLSVNCLDDEMLDNARRDFLVAQAQSEK